MVLIAHNGGTREPIGGTWESAWKYYVERHRTPGRKVKWYAVELHVGGGEHTARASSRKDALDRIERMRRGRGIISA